MPKGNGVVVAGTPIAVDHWTRAPGVRLYFLTHMHQGGEQRRAAPRAPGGRRAAGAAHSRRVSRALCVCVCVCGVLCAAPMGNGLCDTARLRSYGGTDVVMGRGAHLLLPRHSRARAAQVSVTRGCGGEAPPLSCAGVRTSPLIRG